MNILKKSKYRTYIIVSAITSCGVIVQTRREENVYSNNVVRSEFCVIDTYRMVITFNPLCPRIVTVHSSAHTTMCFYCYYTTLLIFLQDAIFICLL